MSIIDNPQVESDYKNDIKAAFNARVSYDDPYTTHRAELLVEFADIKHDSIVLDAATGTAIAAIAASTNIGNGGRIIGVDISRVMLNQAKLKIKNQGIHNISLVEADCDGFHLYPKSIDTVLCSSSIMWFSNISDTLSNWHRWLKYNGTVAFSCYSEDSFLIPLVCEIFSDHHIDLPNCNAQLGTIDRCKNYLVKTGYSGIELSTIDLSCYLSIEKAKKIWEGNNKWFSTSTNPIKQLSERKKKYIKKILDEKIDEIATEQGVFNKINMFLVKARKC